MRLVDEDFPPEDWIAPAPWDIKPITSPLGDTPGEPQPIQRWIAIGAGAVMLVTAVLIGRRLGRLGRVSDERFLAAEEEFQDAALLFDRELNSRMVDCEELQKLLRAMCRAWRMSGYDHDLQMQMRMREQRFSVECRHELAGFNVRKN